MSDQSDIYLDTAKQRLKQMIALQRPPLVQCLVTALMVGLIYFIVGSWPIVGVILGSLYLHEAGHWILFRVNGVKARILMLLPYGAATVPLNDEEFRRLNALPWWNLCLTLFAGLFVNCVILVIAYMAPKTEWVWYLLFTNGLLNLANLIPLSLTDGGMIVIYLMHSLRQPVRYWITNIGVFILLGITIGFLAGLRPYSVPGWQMSVLSGYLMVFALGLYRKQYPVTFPKGPVIRLTTAQSWIVGCSYVAMLVLTAVCMWIGPLPW